VVGAALAAPASADSAAKGKFKFAESRRIKRMKKNAKIMSFLERKTLAIASLKNF